MANEDYLVDTTGFLPLEKVRPGRYLKDGKKHIDEVSNAQDFIVEIGLEISGLRENKIDPPDVMYLQEGNEDASRFLFIHCHQRPAMSPHSQLHHRTPAQP
jgi:hypothetical protein